MKHVIKRIDDISLITNYPIMTHPNFNTHKETIFCAIIYERVNNKAGAKG
jgi:hypothetical protein